MKQQRNMNSGKKIKAIDQAFLFSTMSDLLSSGFSVKQSMDFLLVVSKRNRTLIQRIINGLEDGKRLPEAMRFFLKEPIYQQLLIADENGNLLNGLHEIGNFIRMRINQTEKTRSVIMYPAFLFILLFGIIASLKIFIEPETASLMETNVQHCNSMIWFILTLIVFLIFTGYEYYLFSKKTAIKRIDFLCKLPLIGRAFSSYYQYFVAMNLSVMIKNGLDIKQITKIFLNLKDGTLLNEIGKSLSLGLSEGQTISEILKEFKFLSEEMIVFTSNGSTNAELAENLDALSKLSFKQMVKRSEFMIKMIQPISFSIIGITIVFTYLQMLLPMYDSMKGIY